MENRESSSNLRKILKRALPPKSSISKRPKEDPRVEEVYNILKTTVAENKNERDEHDVFGEYVARTLRTLDSPSKVLAKHYINQVLFEAEMRRLQQPPYAQLPPHHQSAYSSATTTPLPSSSNSTLFNYNNYQYHNQPVEGKHLANIQSPPQDQHSSSASAYSSTTTTPVPSPSNHTVVNNINNNQQYQHPQGAMSDLGSAVATYFKNFQ